MVLLTARSASLVLLAGLGAGEARARAATGKDALLASNPGPGLDVAPWKLRVTTVRVSKTDIADYIGRRPGQSAHHVKPTDARPLVHRGTPNS